MKSSLFHLQKRIRKIIQPVIKHLYWKYTQEERDYQYLQFKLKILPTVFPPRFFYGTKMLIRFLKGEDLKNKTLLEIGSGAGLIALFAASEGAVVTATDISDAAVKNTKLNAKLNNISLTVQKADLFKKLKKTKYDWIISNPPFLAKEPSSDLERGWFCGKDLEFFETFFINVKNYIHETSQVFIVLTDSAPIKEIVFLAGKNELLMSVIKIKKHFLQRSFIFQISKTPSF